MGGSMIGVNIDGIYYYKEKDILDYLNVSAQSFLKYCELNKLKPKIICDVYLYPLAKPEVRVSQRTRSTKEKSNGSQFFEAYSNAYKKRYGVLPVRNTKQNAISFQITTRLGLEDSLQLAEFYLNHDDMFYVKNLHPLGLLLNSCESLVTQMKSGYKMNNVIAKREEKRLSFNTDKEEIEKYFNDKRGSN